MLIAFPPGTRIGIDVICAAQAQVPDTAAGKQFSAWLQAFNSGGDAYREFLQKTFPSRLQRIDGDLDLRERSGGFDVKKVEQATPTKIVALAVADLLGGNV